MLRLGLMEYRWALELMEHLAEAQRLAGQIDRATAHAARAAELADTHGRAYDRELARQIRASLVEPEAGRAAAGSPPGEGGSR